MPGGLSGTEAVNVKSFFEKTKAEDYGNDTNIEMQWAVKAFMHAETYFNIISAVDPKNLRLSQMDDQIFTKFKEDFPDFDLKILDEEKMKSKEGKEKWRVFCESFNGCVEDYSMGTLIRINAEDEPTEKNTMLGHRIQFIAIEIARNRTGLNSTLRDRFGKKSSQAAKEADKESTDKTESDKSASDKS